MRGAGLAVLAGWLTSTTCMQMHACDMMHAALAARDGDALLTLLTLLALSARLVGFATLRSGRLTMQQGGLLQHVKSL